MEDFEEEAQLGTTDTFSPTDFAESIQHLDFTHDASFFQQFATFWATRKILREVVKKGKEWREKGGEFTRMVRVRSKEKLANLLEDTKKVRDISKEKINLPPFLRFVDKLGFVLGILLLLITEYFLLEIPEKMHLLYTALIFPLLGIRFLLYHKIKFHYFMLDFCYYVQVLLLYYLYSLGYSSTAFQILFALSNGPLLWAIVLWKNSLVFHDWDKMTSLFIHAYPPIVLYCIRWSSSEQFGVCCDLTSTSTCRNNIECSISVWNWLVYPMLFYVFWQILYILKTEVIDRKKFEKDKELMTSLRWFTLKKPHPVYKFLIKRGLPPTTFYQKLALLLSQLIYTLVTLLGIKIIFESYWLHTMTVSFCLFVGLWNGATFYFEVFSDSYSARLNSANKKEKDEEGSPLMGLRSFVSFALFFGVSAVLLHHFMSVA